MKYYPIPALYGVVKDYHPRMIPDNKVQDCLNVVFKNGRVQTRNGYASLGGGLPLSGAIMGIAFLDLVRSGESHTCVFTTRDAYRFDPVSGNWKYITKCYSTGTVTTSGTGLRTVTLSTGTFSTAWTKSVYKIGFGTTDPDAVTTWYSVSTINDTTHLTLGEDGPTAAGSTYVLRLCFSGTDSDYFSFSYPYLDGAGDKILCATNGVDEIMKWTGTGKMDYLGGSPNLAKYVGYFGANLSEIMFAAHITDTGVVHPQQVDLSDGGDPETWSGTYYEFLITNDEITNIMGLGTRLVVYKSNSITVGFVSDGDSADPMDWEQNKITNVGTKYGRTVVDFGGFHIFLGDSDLYKFNGMSLQSVGAEVINTIKEEINREYAHRVFAVPLMSENLYVLFVPTGEELDEDGVVIKAASEYPDKAYVFNYVENTWSIWKLADDMVSYGFIRRDYSPTWDEIRAQNILIDDMNLRWADLIQFSNTESLIFGDRNGYLFEWKSIFEDDDGTDIDASVTTKDFPVNDPKHTFNVNEIVVGYQKQDVGNELKVRVSIDFAEPRSVDPTDRWSDYVQFDQNGDGTSRFQETICNFIEHGRQLRVELQNVTGSKFSVESLIVGYNDEGGVIK